MYNKANQAQVSIPALKDTLHSLLEQTAITLVTVCNVDHELKDITNFGVEAYKLQQRCEELINAIARIQNLGRVMELNSAGLLEPLGWEAEHDDKRNEWYLTDDGCEE